MRKIVAILLVLCTCCLALTACFGKDNEYQTFIKDNTNKEFEIKKTSGESKKNIVTDYYKLEGKVSVDYKRILAASVTETTQVAGDDEHRSVVELTVRYDERDTIVEVVVKNYTYSCVALADDDHYHWKDGYTFETPKSSEGAILTRFKFDINKYFENGKLTVEDAEEAMKLDASGITKDLSWPTTDSKYTARNTDWEAKALADIMDTVNATLAEIDAIIEK